MLKAPHLVANIPKHIMFRRSPTGIPHTPQHQGPGATHMAKRGLVYRDSTSGHVPFSHKGRCLPSPKTITVAQGNSNPLEKVRVPQRENLVRMYICTYLGNCGHAMCAWITFARPPSLVHLLQFVNFGRHHPVHCTQQIATPRHGSGAPQHESASILP